MKAKRTMWNTLIRILSAKIQINIILEQADKTIKSTKEPYVVEKKSMINYIRKSNYRFIQKDESGEISGVQRSYWFTEEKCSYGWVMTKNSFFCDKKEAWEVHCKIIEGLYSCPKQDINTVLWEGLSAEEAKVWGALQV